MNTLLRSLLLAIVLSCAVLAQSPTGTITGTVLDSSAAVIPGAAVTLTNAETGLTKSGQTDSAGSFVFPLLPPGRYRIEVGFRGFKKYVQDRFVLNVAERPNLVVTLLPGAPTETVEVKAEAEALLETVTSDIGQLISRRQVDNLPLNGRSVFALQLLSNGVTPTNGNSTSYNAAYINGGRQGTSNILLDGVANTVSENTAGTLAPAREPPLDSVEEFKVMTSGMSAEYGNSMGGVIAMVTRSGSNELHGSAFEFLRNGNLNANNFFANKYGSPRPPTKKNQFGGSLGWRIKRDKTFFFVDYQGDRQRGTDNMLATVPTAKMRAGDFSELPGRLYNPYSTVAPNDVLARSDSRYGRYSYRGGNTACAAAVPGSGDGSHGSARPRFPGNIIPSACLDPVALAAIQYYPMPNRPGLVDNYFDSAVSSYTRNNWDVKLDHYFSDSHRAFFRYGRDTDNGANANHFKTVADPQYRPYLDRNQNAAYEHNYTASPTTILTFRYGYSRNFPDQGVDPGLQDFSLSSLGFPKTLSDISDNSQPRYFTRFDISGYTSLGTATYSGYRNAADVHTLGASVYKIRGSHNLKTGYTGHLYRDNGVQPGYPSGLFQFWGSMYTSGPYPWGSGGSALADFMIGGSGWRGWSVPVATATQSFSHSVYLQDDWRVNSKLTLNLGVRWDLSIPRTERYNRASYWNPNAVSPVQIDPSVVTGLESQLGRQLPALRNLKGGLEFPGVGGASRHVFATNWADIAPRVGLAYSVTPKTVIRSAFGIMYGPSYSSATGPGGYTTDGFGIPWTGGASAFYAPDGHQEPLYTFANAFPYGVGLVTGSSRGAATLLGGDFSGAGNYSQPEPCSINWNFGIERALPSQMLIQVSYVGSRALHWAVDYHVSENQLSGDQIQAGVAQYGTAFDAAMYPNPLFDVVGPGGQYANPNSPYFYPLVSAYNLTANYPQFNAPYINLPLMGNSLYNALQLRIEKRAASGLSFLVAYTASKLMSNGEGAWRWNGTHGAIQDFRNLANERSLDANDIPQRLTAYYIYQLPFGRGRRFGANLHPILNGILGGWQNQSMFTIQSGVPVVWGGSQTNYNRFLPSQRPDKICDGRLSGSVKGRMDQYFDTSCFAEPAPFSIGTAPRTDPHIRWPGMKSWDFSMFKEFQFSEKYKLQVRSEFFNFTNTPIFGAPGSDFSDTSHFGRVTWTNNGPREIQFALRLLF